MAEKPNRTRSPRRAANGAGALRPERIYCSGRSHAVGNGGRGAAWTTLASLLFWCGLIPGMTRVSVGVGDPRIFHRMVVYMTCSCGHHIQLHGDSGCNAAGKQWHCPCTRSEEAVFSSQFDGVLKALHEQLNRRLVTSQTSHPN